MITISLIYKKGKAMSLNIHNTDLPNTNWLKPVNNQPLVLSTAARSANETVAPDNAATTTVALIDKGVTIESGVTADDEVKVQAMARTYHGKQLPEDEAVYLIAWKLPNVHLMHIESLVQQVYAEKIKYPGKTHGEMADYCLSELNGNLRKVEQSHTFWHWVDGKWQHNLTDETLSTIVLGTLRNQPALSDPRYKGPYKTWINTTSNITSTLNYLKMCCPKVKLADINTDPYLFNMQNGVFDLRTLSSRPALPSEYLVMFSNVTYDEKATCPLWEKFIDEITLGDQEFARYLQMMAGYFLLGDNPLRRVFFLIGSGSNGKSTFVHVLEYLLKDYCSPIHGFTVKTKKQEGKGDDLMALVNKRLYLYAELKAKDMLDVTLVKAISAGESQLARNLFQNFVIIALLGKLLFHSNEMPRVSDSSNAFYNRINILTFKLDLEETNAADNELEDKLKEEIAGIFNWAVEGVRMAGPKWENFVETASMQAEKKAYRAENDTIQNFIDHCYIIDPQQRSPSKQVYDDYNLWMSMQYPDTHRSVQDAALKSKFTAKSIKFSSSNGSWLGMVRNPEWAAQFGQDDSENALDNTQTI